MKRNKILAAMFFLTLGNTTAWSQLSEKEVLAKLNYTYMNASSYSMRIETEIYQNTNDKTPVRSYKGNVAKSGSLFYSEMMGKTSLTNSSCVLMVDNFQKKIFYSKAGKGKLPGKNSGSVESQIDSLVKQYSSIKFFAGTETAYKIEIMSALTDPYYKSILMTINKGSFALEEITFVYKDDAEIPYNKVVIKYLEVKINQKIADDFFSEVKFISKSKSKIMPSQAYSSYMVINNDDIKLPNH